MPEREVKVEEAISLVRSLAGKLLHADTEINHFTLFYEINLAKGSRFCTVSDYCKKSAVVLKHERDHRGVSWVALMCTDHAPRIALEKMSSG